MRLVDAEFFLKKFSHNHRHYNIELRKTPLNSPLFKLLQEVIDLFKSNIKYINEHRVDVIPPGFPTHTKDKNGDIICVGDRVGFDFPDSTSIFTVVFRNNAFRKFYDGWDDDIEGNILESTNASKEFRYIIKQRATDKKEEKLWQQ